eukprot:scaffold13279_cov114-Isochrysis_galbana.AAC.2
MPPMSFPPCELLPPLKLRAPPPPPPRALAARIRSAVAGGACAWNLPRHPSRSASNCSVCTQQSTVSTGTKSRYRRENSPSEARAKAPKAEAFDALWNTCAIAGSCWCASLKSRLYRPCPMTPHAQSETYIEHGFRTDEMMYDSRMSASVTDSCSVLITSVPSARSGAYSAFSLLMTACPPVFATCLKTSRSRDGRGGRDDTPLALQASNVASMRRCW